MVAMNPWHSFACPQEGVHTAMLRGTAHAQVILLLALLPASGWGQANAPKDFKFTQIDEKVLDEVETVEHQFEKKGLVFNDPALDAHLEQLAKPILQSAGTPDRVHWKLRVLRDPSVNAFAMPNGSIYVHTGLLSLLEDDAELAGILAHEITHVTNRHTFQQYRSYRKKAVALHVLAAAASLAPTNTAWGAAINVVANVSGAALVVSIFGYSRELEREADLAAVDRMAAAGYDPAALPKTFKLLDEKLEVEPVVTFYRDHPKLEERTAYTASTAKAAQIAKRAPVPSSESYLSTVEKAVQYNVQADIDSRRFRTAVARAQRLVALRPTDARNLFLLAEAYRELGPRTAEPTEKDLTSRGKADTRKLLVKRTAIEEEKELLERPEGPATRKANEARAEELYRKAQAADGAFAPAYRGLGLLCEGQGRTDEALRAYQKYLDLAPDASDRLRIQRRLEALDKELKTSGRKE